MILVHLVIWHLFNGGNWRVPGEEIMLSLTVVEPKVIDKLKRTSHHFIELMLKCNWKSTSKGLIVNLY